MKTLNYITEKESNQKPTLKNHSKINIPCSKGLKIDGFDRYLKNEYGYITIRLNRRLRGYEQKHSHVESEIINYIEVVTSEMWCNVYTRRT